MNLGVWKDQETGITYLDLSLVLSDRDTALAAGSALAEKAAWDFAGNALLPMPAAGRQTANMPQLYQRLEELRSKVQPVASVEP